MRLKKNVSNTVFLRINNAANWKRIMLGIFTGGLSEVVAGAVQSGKGIKLNGQPAAAEEEEEEVYTPPPRR